MLLLSDEIHRLYFTKWFPLEEDYFFFVFHCCFVLDILEFLDVLETNPP